MLNEEIIRRLSPITPEERDILAGRASIDRSLYMDSDARGDVVSGGKLLEPGKLITVRKHTRFIRFPPHSHDYVEMVYMCKGTTTHIVDGTSLTLREGDLLLLGQNAKQEILKAGEKDIAVNFVVRPEFFGGTLSFLGAEETPLSRFITDCLCGGSGTDYLLFCVADVLPVQNLLENLLWMLINESPNRHNLNQVTVGLLFAHLLDCTRCLTLRSAEQEAVVWVLRYLEEHYREGSLGEAARQLHYELPALSRLIKKKTGKTYTELLQEKRLAQAAWLLRNTRRNVDEIARSVGYENISYFHRLFFSAFGCSPKKYRDCK